MKIEEIKTIVELMSKNDLTEFKIEAEEMKLCLKREKGDIQVQQIQSAMPQMMAAPMPVSVKKFSHAQPPMHPAPTRCHM